MRRRTLTACPMDVVDQPPSEVPHSTRSAFHQTIDGAHTGPQSDVKNEGIEYCSPTSAHQQRWCTCPINPTSLVLDCSNCLFNPTKGDRSSKIVTRVQT